MMARSKVSKQRSDSLTQTVSSIQNIPLATHGRSIDLRVDSSSLMIRAFGAHCQFRTHALQQIRWNVCAGLLP
jgi:hypothetical protein